MKKICLILTLALTLTSAIAQNVCSVVTCPGEDSSNSMRISWAADSKGSKVIFKQASENNWQNATTLRPETEFFCVTFDSIYSKAPDNTNIYEDAKIIKCGATLKGLTPNTAYDYVIADKNGKHLTSAHSFKTAGANEWSCCVISDFHAYTPLLHRQRDAMDMMDAVKNFDPNFSWVLHLGDITAWGGSWSFWKSLYQERYFMPYMWAGVNGNHDNMTRGYIRNSNDFFRQANYYPENGYLGEEGVCYHFRYGNVMFIMLNNEAMHTEKGLIEAQNWVQEVVTEAKNSENAPLYTVVCEHYQWFNGVNGKDSQYSRWCKLFDRLGIDLALAGNNHIYVRTDAIFNGKNTDGTKGTVYLQTPSSDNERGQKMNDEFSHNKQFIKYRWTEGPKTVGAMSMKVNNEKITITLLDRNGKVIDTAQVLAKKK